MAVQIGPRIGIEGEEKYRSSIMKIIQQAKTLDSEMKKLTSSFDKDDKSLRKNAEQRKLLTQQIENQKKRVQELTQMADKAGQEMGEEANETLKWKQAVNEATAELNRMEGELRNLPSSLQTVGNAFKDAGAKMKDIGGSISSTGKSLTTKVTLPLVGIATAAVKSTAEFDKQMSAVKAVSGATGEELEALRNSAIDMSKGMAYSATEIAEAQYYMGLAGWNTNQIIAAQAGVANLAAAGNMDLGRASDIVTDYMTALGIAVDGTTNGISNADHFVNVLTATMTNSNTDVDMMGEAFKYAATTAGTLDFSLEDLSFAMGLMANNGIKSSQAGTTLRNIMQRMAKPTDEVATAMEKLGVGLDADGNMLSFGEILDDLREGFAGVMVPEEEFQEAVGVLNDQLEAGIITKKQYNKELESMIGDTYGAEQAQKAMYAAMLGGARGMAGILAIANTTDEEYQALKEAIYGADEAFVEHEGKLYTLQDAYAQFGDEVANMKKVGAAEGVAGIQLDNLSGDITKVKNDITALGIELASTTTGPMRDFAQGISGWIDKIRQLSPEQQALIIKIGAVVAAIGPALMLIGGVVSAVGTIAGAIGTLIPIIGAVVAAAGPLLIGGAIIGGLVAGAIWLNDNWETVKEVAGQVWEGVKEAWNGVKESFTSAVTEIGTELGAGWEAIKTGASEAWDTVSAWTSEKWTGIKETVTTKAEEIRLAAEEKWNNIKDNAGGAWETISGTVTEKTGIILTTVQGKLGEIVAAYEEHNGGLDGVVAAGWQAIEEYYTLGYDTLNALTDGKLGEIMGLFQTNLGSLGTKALEWGRDMVNSLVQGISETWDNVKDGAVSLAGKIAGALHFSEPDYGPLSNFHTFMPDMVDLMVTGMDQNAWRVRRAAEGLAEEISVALPPSRYEYEANMQHEIAGLNDVLATKDTNVNVTLGGDAGKWLRVLAVENNKRTKATNYNALGGY